MDASTKSHMTLNTLEKGLRSRVLHEKMATIVNMTTFLRENPFPFFVNAAVLRLCEAFRDECNELRLCIVRVVGECSTELRLVFSNDEVARRVLKVSHSNDPLARSLTLQVLAKLASVVAENKQIHHLVVSSIDSEEAQERLSAIVATEAFVAVSRSFSQTVFEKLCITFLSPLISPTTKIGLVGVFANMQADVEIIMKVFALGERILNEAYNQQLMLALINSLTTLAVSCKFAVSELLTLLIEKLKISKENRTLCVAILYNIKRLSSAAHMLTKSHMHDLLSFGDTLTDDLIRVYWLITLVRFTSRSIHKIIAMLSDNIAHWTYLLSSRNDDVRLAVLHLFINIYKYSQKSDIISTLKSSFIISLPTVKSQDSERFYRLLTAFICDDSCPRETVDAIVDALLIVPLPDFSALHVLQFLVAAAEIHSHLYSRLRIWSLSKLNENTNLTKLTLFSCLVYAPLSDITELPKNHLDFWGNDPWVLYLVARSAMRNGHWKLVALPILDIIHKKVKSFQTRIWLIALRDICCASLSEFNVFSLEKSIESLNSARLSLSTLCSSREFIRYFIFPLRFVDCLCNMYAALRSFLVVINTNLLLNDKPAPYIMKKVSTRLQTCAIKLHKCRDMWLDLYKHCFDADASTMTFVELYSGMCALFSAALQLFVKQQPLSPLSISSSSHYSLANKRLRISLLWAKREIEKLDIITLEKRITRKNLKFLVDTFGYLCSVPICIPRFFFQQLRYTQIKLNVLPQPGPTDTAIAVSSNQKLPISIEGAIESSHASSVDAVIVKAVAKFARGSSKNGSQIQTVTPQEGKFFNAQFLLAFPQSCTMEFSVNFLDKETKRLWESDVTAELKIHVSS
ncbi:Integrator complex subunit [Dirofilaria immitis]